ncbi:Flagellar C1a complex subunit C1a-32 [Plasmodiophora brassicae]
MLIRHSVRRSPRSIAVFSLVDVKSLMSFFLDRVFRFLHLYQYVLGRTRHLHLQTERALAPTPTVYPPLSSATLVPADQPNAKSEQEPATNGAASNGTQAAGESQHAPDEQPSTVGGPPPLTDDEINMIMSDPEAKAALQALLDPRLAALQKRLDDQLDAMDRQFQLEADRITSASLAVRDPPAIQQG